MQTAIDIYAETNPAFITFGAVTFCRRFTEVAELPPHFSLIYLAVPLAMSDDLQESFDKTNARTGLLAWLTRYPDVRFGLAPRLEATLPIVTAGIQLGVLTRALDLGQNGDLILGSAAPAKALGEKLPPQARQVLKRAERLGAWMGTAGKAAAIFSAFGVAP